MWWWRGISRLGDDLADSDFSIWNYHFALIEPKHVGKDVLNPKFVFPIPNWIRISHHSFLNRIQNKTMRRREKCILRHQQQQWCSNSAKVRFPMKWFCWIRELRKDLNDEMEEEAEIEVWDSKFSFHVSTICFHQEIEEMEEKAEVEEKSCRLQQVCYRKRNWWSFKECWGWEAKEQKHKFERNAIWGWRETQFVVVVVGSLRCVGGGDRSEQWWWWWWWKEEERRGIMVSLPLFSFIKDKMVISGVICLVIHVFSNQITSRH